MPQRGLIKKTKSPVSKVAKPIKPKGTIKGKGGGVVGILKGAISGGIRNLPFVGGAVSGALDAYSSYKVHPVTGQLVPRRKKHKGLTYREIKGAMKLLRLVKRFAPPGHRTALRSRPARSRMY